MVNQSIKDKVLESLQNINDEVSLQNLLNYIQIESDKDAIYELNDNQLRLINETKRQVKDGEI